MYGIICAAHCKPWTLGSPKNGHKSCRNNTSDWTCVFTCRPGYVFYNETSPVMTSCVSGQTNWTNARSIPNCVGKL